MSKLLSPANVAGLELKNRVVLPPMCMYMVKNKDGMVTPFHHAHYGARAIGQVGLIIIEATAVEPDGRLSDYDLGLWSDAQVPGLKKLVEELQAYGTKVGIQLGHGGRKAVHAIHPIAPSTSQFNENYKEAKEMTSDDIKRVQQSFVDAAKRAITAGVDVIQLHGAHGYLINQFLEPQTNHRTDIYGGELRNRYRFLSEIVREIRGFFTGSLWVRLSMQAYVHDGRINSLDEYQQIGQWLEADGVDCLNISSGGLMDVFPTIPVFSGYQVPFAVKMKEAVQIPVTAVGMLNAPEIGEYILQTNQADLVEVGRMLIRNVNWLADAAQILHDKEFHVFNESYKRGQVR